MLVPSLVLTLAVVACAKPAETPPAAPPVDAAAMKDSIQAREREWSAAFKAGDAAAVANLYSEDGATVQPAGDWYRGRAAITEGTKKQLDTVNVTAREDITEEVIPAGDYVVEIGHYSMAGTTKKGNKPISTAGRYMVVWRKDADGVWRLYRDIGSEAPAPKK
ncbi:MAG TPA: SgcJ/EcaC family oxidoreductase [Gemmatimonadaceae bacterium]|nr:SgcJ/EcaC family oxidoreductase [Gemmatimonadaceae bacterium]